MSFLYALVCVHKYYDKVRLKFFEDYLPLSYLDVVLLKLLLLFLVNGVLISCYSVSFQSVCLYKREQTDSFTNILWQSMSCGSRSFVPSHANDTQIVMGYLG